MGQKELSLQERVREQMMDLIHSMDFDFSTRMLSEKQLAAKFRVSRTTIRTVLAELETEGKIIRRQGSGTYVNPAALNLETTIHPRVSMYEMIRKNGFEPSLKIASVQSVAAGAFGGKLNLYSFDNILEVHSVYYGDNRPCMYCIDRVEAKEYAGVDWKTQETFRGSIYDFIRQTVGVEIAWDIIHIQAAVSTQFPALQEFFQVPEGLAKPLVQLEITNFNARNQPVLLGNIYIDSDLVQLNIVRDLTKM